MIAKCKSIGGMPCSVFTFMLLIKWFHIGSVTGRPTTNTADQGPALEPIRNYVY